MMRARAKVALIQVTPTAMCTKAITGIAVTRLPVNNTRACVRACVGVHVWVWVGGCDWVNECYQKLSTGTNYVWFLPHSLSLRLHDAGGFTFQTLTPTQHPQYNTAAMYAPH
jgi:hypothetical protein